jgi:hypothetical protein
VPPIVLVAFVGIPIEVVLLNVVFLSVAMCFSSL